MWQEILKNEKKMKKIAQTAFKAIDFNNNQLIQKDQLQEIMTTTADDLGIQRPAKQQIKQVMKQLDTSNNGYLSKNDFKLLTQQVIKLINKAQQI